jgi:hypothetical protein
VSRDDVFDGERQVTDAVLDRKKTVAAVSGP